MRNTKENTSERRRKCTDDPVLRLLTIRAHKPLEMGASRHMHQRDKARIHLSASQRKEGLGECHLGPADPLGRPNPNGL